MHPSLAHACVTQVSPQPVGAKTAIALQSGVFSPPLRGQRFSAGLRNSLDESSSQAELSNVRRCVRKRLWRAIFRAQWTLWDDFRTLKYLRVGSISSDEMGFDGTVPPLSLPRKMRRVHTDM
jgi:hypothetical protein